MNNKKTFSINFYNWNLGGYDLVLIIVQFNTIWLCIWMSETLQKVE